MVWMRVHVRRRGRRGRRPRRQQTKETVLKQKASPW